MKRHSVSLFAGLLALLFYCGVQAHADPIRWSYVGSADGVRPGEFGKVLVTSGIPGSAQDGVELVTARNSLTGPRTIDILRLEAFYFSENDLGTFTHAGYHLSLFLHDEASGEAGLLDFFGEFNGTLSPTEADITNAFPGPTQQSLTLGRNRYTVTLGAYVPPGPPGGAPGRIEAHVDVRGVPEPATLTLAGMGVSLLGGAAWRAWRRRAIGPAT
jgi:PEP-CTERM motif